MANNFRVAGFVLGLAIKAPCHTVATSNITNPTGTSANPINGYSVAPFDRVLLLAQTDPIDNGIYSVRETAWIRDGDADGNRDFVGGTIVPVWSAGQSTILLYRLSGDPDAKTIGVDALNFTLYYDPGAFVEVDTLQTVTARENTTDQGMVITGGMDMVLMGAGGQLDIQDGGSIQIADDSVTPKQVLLRVDDTTLAPFTMLSFNDINGIEGYNFTEDINIQAGSGGVFVGGTGRIGFYAKGDSISSYIRGASGSPNIEYFAVVGEHHFTGLIDLASYRIAVFQFSISANAVTIDVNDTSACFIDIEEASGDFTVTLTAPLITGTYQEMNIDFLQGSTPFQPIWPASVKWPGGTAPTLSAANNALDTVHLYTRDAGATWKGSFLLDYS